MHKTLFFSIAAIICCNAFSQSYQNNWVFGDSSGLNFSGPGPLFFETAITSFESCASISDTVGNLLFYTNGRNAWNKNNEVMPNGDSLNIGAVSGVYESSLTQGVIILPKPGNVNQFYLIVNRYTSPNYGLEYSIIDINLEGGLGDVSEKNTEIYSDKVFEKMSAVKHGNGKDWWLFFMVATESEVVLDLLRILITEDGIQIPDTVQIGPLINLGAPGGGAKGQLKFSKNGQKLAFTRGNYFLLFDFDRCTGELSNLQEVNINDSAYGCEFSADGRYLYLTRETDLGSLMQFCLTCPEPIEDTKEIIFESIYADHGLTQLQLGPDDKIYVGMTHENYAAHIHDFITENISVINNPDIQGLDCNFDTLSIPVTPGRVTYSLPNMPNYNLGPLAGSECDTLGTAIHNVETINNIFNIYPNPAINYFVITCNDPEFTYQNIQQLEIFDIAGKKIKSISALTSNTINIEDIPNGMYFIKLHLKNKPVEVFKILIEK